MKKTLIARYGFAVIMILLGIILNALGFNKEYLGFESIGSWLTFVGFIMLAVITLQTMNKTKPKRDERTEYLALRAGRVTFVFIILGAFTIMIIDGIKPITVSYSMFMSHLIAWMMVVYFVSYKWLEKKN